jgi:hypothetical protein
MISAKLCSKRPLSNLLTSMDDPVFIGILSGLVVIGAWYYIKAIVDRASHHEDDDSN